jgi:hypothetical protein
MRMFSTLLYRMCPHNERRVSEAAKGADPIQPFEGSRPWKGNYGNSMGMGLRGRLPEQVEALDKSKAR